MTMHRVVCDGCGNGSPYMETRHGEFGSFCKGCWPVIEDAVRKARADLNGGHVLPATWLQRVIRAVLG